MQYATSARGLVAEMAEKMAEIENRTILSSPILNAIYCYNTASYISVTQRSDAYLLCTSPLLDVQHDLLP